MDFTPHNSSGSKEFSLSLLKGKKKSIAGKKKGTVLGGGFDDEEDDEKSDGFISELEKKK